MLSTLFPPVGVQLLTLEYNDLLSSQFLLGGCTANMESLVITI